MSIQRFSHVSPAAVSPRRHFLKRALAGSLLALSLVACGGTPAADNSEADSAENGAAGGEGETLVVGGIPDQDPEKLQRQYGILADYLEAELGVPVEYKPVTDYAAAVTAFKVGDLEMVWFGGLTGVQARLQTEGAEAIVQRDVDEQFQSVFIANADAGIAPLNGIEDLQTLKGKTFTFGSESSTSGRLMPQYFLKQGEVSLDDFQGEPGFSGDHDKTIKLVEAGTYQVGAVNGKVWEARLESGAVDTDRVVEIWRTPPYYDYHWVVHPQVEEQYGPEFVESIRTAFLNLDPSVPEQQEILDLFSAGAFIPTSNENYAQIEEIGREIGKIQ